jgi:hypothetical protein
MIGVPMGVLRKSCIAMMMLCSAAFASESSDLLDAFNQLTLEDPDVAYDYWDGSGSFSSNEYKSYYRQQFQDYVDVATRLSIRAIACAEGDIPSAEGYQSMADLKDLYVSIAKTLTETETQLKLWYDLNDEDALEEVAGLVPELSVAYSRMLFELSSCSGYLYGELVN